MKKITGKNRTPIVILTLTSDIYFDAFTIEENQYKEFVDVFEKSQFFDEDVINDLLYFAEEMFKNSKFCTTKQQLRLKIADLADIITPDQLIDLKRSEFKPLLNATKRNYYAIFHNLLQSDNVDEDEILNPK